MGGRTPLVRDSAEELPPGVMRAVARPSREQDLDFHGATRARLLLCTHPQGSLVKSIRLRASRWISLECWERQAPGLHQRRWKLLRT